MFPARTDSNSGNSNSSYAEQSAKTLAQYRTSHLVIISSTIATSGFLAFFAIYSLFAGNYLMAVIASCFSMFYLWWIAPNIFMSHASLIVCRESGKTNLFQLEHQGKKTLAFIELLPIRKKETVDYLLSIICLAQLSQGKFDEAREILEKLKANNLKNKKNRHALPKIILDSSNLSVTLISMGEIESGIIEAESALLQCSALGETDRIIRVFPLVNLALAYLELGRIDEGGKIALEAEKEFLEAKKLPIWLMQSSFDQAKAINLLNLAKWAFMVEKNERAMNYIDKYISFVAGNSDIISSSSIKQIAELADLCIEHRYSTEAEKLLDLAYSKARLIPDHPYALVVLDIYEKFLAGCRRDEEIKIMKSWLLPSI